jgi:hypothetical protein
VKPYEAGDYFVRRAGLAKLTSPATPATPADRQLDAEGGSEPAAGAEESMPEPAPAVEPQPASSSPQVEPVSPDAETGQEESSPPGKQPDEPTVADPTRPPSDKELKDFVAKFIKNTNTDAGEIPTKKGLYQKARDALPRATRKRLFDEFELQAKTLPPGRPRKNRR